MPCRENISDPQGHEVATAELAKALHHAMVTGATMVMAKLADNGDVALRAVESANAAAFAQDLAPVLADIRAGGATSLRAIAAELTARGIRTRRGGVWGVGHVRGLQVRLIEA
jgi:hypothetical protein